MLNDLEVSSINGKVRFPNLEFFAQSVNHPSINLAPAIQPFRGVDAAFPGDKIDYTELNMLVMLDENMQIYEEMKTWLEDTVYKNVQRPTSIAADSTASCKLPMASTSPNLTAVVPAQTRPCAILSTSSTDISRPCATNPMNFW